MNIIYILSNHTFVVVCEYDIRPISSRYTDIFIGEDHVKRLSEIQTYNRRIIKYGKLTILIGIDAIISM